jgi:hypothetical protein
MCESTSATTASREPQAGLEALGVRGVGVIAPARDPGQTRSLDSMSSGALLVCEAGGTTADLDGAPTGICQTSGDILAGAANLHRQLKTLLRWVYGSDTSPLPTLSATGEH